MIAPINRQYMKLTFFILRSVRASLKQCLLTTKLFLRDELSFVLLSQRTFHYDSNYWSNKESYNLEGGMTGFDRQETKLLTYWNTPFSLIMKLTFFILRSAAPIF